ncbi:hypothetical protein GCM10009609_65310 [Pseudonocardia aurantiaca]|uniref:Uncharacterized protein n=1 Tax=Pseudonocardia aurantiaca TaxID=75290 RepID=A0ABW4FSV3_9PSEU
MAEEIYLSEANPTSLADVIVDNTEFGAPRIVTRAPPRTASSSQR